MLNILALQLSPNPPVRIVRLVDDRGGLADAREVVKFAGFDRRANFILSKDLNRAVGEHRLRGHNGFSDACLSSGFCADLSFRRLLNVVEVIFHALTHSGTEHHAADRRHQFREERAGFQPHF